MCIRDSQYTSYFDDSKDYSSEDGNVPTRISIVGAEAFVIIGGSVDIYIDGDYLDVYKRQS